MKSRTKLLKRLDRIEAIMQYYGITVTRLSDYMAVNPVYLARVLKGEKKASEMFMRYIELCLSLNDSDLTLYLRGKTVNMIYENLEKEGRISGGKRKRQKQIQALFDEGRKKDTNNKITDSVIDSIDTGLFILGGGLVNFGVTKVLKDMGL